VESAYQRVGFVRNGAAPQLAAASTELHETAFEKHYRIGDLAKLWGLGRETVRKIVKDDPGVIKIRMGRKKAHTIYSVPKSAADRIHTRLLNPP
jgi:hypothetical protein